jgi:hypothetical protein
LLLAVEVSLHGGFSVAKLSADIVLTEGGPADKVVVFDGDQES